MKKIVLMIMAGMLMMGGSAFAGDMNVQGTLTSQDLSVSGTATIFNSNVTNKLGVGTIAPSKTFHLIRGNSAGTDPGFIVNDGALLESDTDLHLQFFTPNDKQASIQWSDPDARMKGALLYDHPSDSMSVWTNGAERVKIDSSGNVGIGTTAPQSTLDVAGDANVSGNIGVAGNVNTSANMDVGGDANVTGDVNVTGTINANGDVNVLGSLLGAAKDVSGNALKICTGKTTSAEWQYESACGKYQEIDTSSCGFTTTPLYFTSLGGGGGKWYSTGASSIYLPTPTSFRVYVAYKPWSCSQAIHISSGWFINWVAIGQ